MIKINKPSSKFFPRCLMEVLKKWIDRREIYAIKGPRQSGKTSLLKMLQKYPGDLEILFSTINRRKL